MIPMEALLGFLETSNVDVTAWHRPIPGWEESTDFRVLLCGVGCALVPGEVLSTRTGIEHGYVIAGRAELSVGVRTVIITVGDSVAFDGSAPHRLRTVGDQTFGAIWVARRGSDGGIAA
jgi:hypothetical protein